MCTARFVEIQVLTRQHARNGHGCMLQYALLHMFGYGVTMDDLKAFRVRSLIIHIEI